MLPAELIELSDISTRLGQNRRLVQGPGGNTSIKLGRVLWVKASGTWLAHARADQIFVPVDLDLLRQEIEANTASPELHTLRFDSIRPDRRPSIETTVHAVLEHRVVIHTHPVNVIAVAVRSDARSILDERMAGLSWIFVPYARPGAPLTRAICEAADKNSPDVLILANHGLVVGASSCAAAMQLIAEVERRLDTAERPAEPSSPGFLARLARGSPYVAPTDPTFHRIATDKASLRIATGGSLYPDHVVFLGPDIAVVQPDGPVGERVRIMGDRPPLLAVSGLGVLIREDLTTAAQSMVGCLADVLPLIPADAPINYLSPAQEAELSNWDAEKYRHGLNQERAPK